VLFRSAVRKGRGKRRPDIVVMDLQMPTLDGWAAIQRLHADPATADIPVIVVTGHDLGAYLKPAALAAGACTFLMKPVAPEALAREIHGCLAARRDAHAASDRRARRG